MYVRSLGLQDFRSWPQANLELTPGRTVFLGANGNGKTNLLEALGYLATLSSHRVATTAPLLRSGTTRARISAVVVNADRELRLDLELAATTRAAVNRSPVRRPREILGILRTVLFAPEDLALVRGDPAERRFLRRVRDGACGLFATVLSPDYNAAHRDHLHLDQADRGMGGWRSCR